MAGNCAIEEPQVLLGLPRALSYASAKVSVAPVYGLAQCRKRKRPELVVGVDEECLNVYNIKNPRLLTSHAIPPQTVLTAAPLSVFKRGQGQASRRFVYAATSHNLGSSSSQIICFREDTLNRGEGPAAPVKTPSDLGSSTNPVVHLDSQFSAGQESGDSHEVLALQRDGALTCLSEDLAETKWVSKLQAPTTSNEQRLQFSYVRLVDALEAAQGLFKYRPEILAVLQPSEAVQESPQPQPQILFTTTHEEQGDSHTAHAFCIRPASSVASQSSIVQYLCSWSLPARRVTEGTTVEQSFDPRTGVFQLRSGSSLINLDLSVSTAKTVSVFASIPSTSTFLPVSSKLTLISSKTSCQLYDTRYKSLQAVQTATAAQVVGNGSRKRKRASLDAANQPIKLIQYFARLGLAVGIVGHEVIGIPLRLSASSKHQQGSRLIDALGKANPSPHAPEQDEVIHALTQLADKRDVTGFEKYFFEVVSTKNNQQSPSKALVKATKAKGKDEILADRRIRQLGECALAAIFTREDGVDKHGGNFGSSEGIRVRFLPTNVFRWLSLYQLVKPEMIATALRHKTSPTMRLKSITCEGIATAVANADPSLVLLSDLVTRHSLTSHTGLVRALRILLRSFDQPQIQQADRMLTTSGAEDGIDAAEDGAENQLEAEESAAQWDLDIASIMLEDGPSGRGLALRVCCEKLAGGAAAREVVRALRDEMSRHDLGLLIELLRFELANGGWTSRCLDYLPTIDAEPVGQDEIIWVICELLNRALDALGTGGWLGFGSGAGVGNDETASDAGDDDSSEQADDEAALMQQLRQDASAVVEGVQESSFFAGFLRDFIRYSDAVANAAPNGANSGRVPDAAAGGEGEAASMLPLGLKQVQRIGTTKVGAGGELQRRSRRDMAAQLSKRVGVYSFEQIRV